MKQLQFLWASNSEAFEATNSLNAPALCALWTAGTEQDR